MRTCDMGVHVHKGRTDAWWTPLGRAQKNLLLAYTRTWRHKWNRTDSAIYLKRCYLSDTCKCYYDCEICTPCALGPNVSSESREYRRLRVSYRIYQEYCPQVLLPEVADWPPYVCTHTHIYTLHGYYVCWIWVRIHGLWMEWFTIDRHTQTLWTIRKHIRVCMVG